MSDVKRIATREGYGRALLELAEEYPNLVVMDADLAGATRTGVFQKKYPERFFNAGIAEGNMMGIAAGLAASGMLPFVSSFAMFATGRAYEQIRNSIGYPRLNVKICASHGGISVGEDGASHQCLEDVALMRQIPGMVVMVPADEVEAAACVHAAAKYDGSVYIRFGRAAVPVINEPGYTCEIGKATVVREGKDVTIAANGLCFTAAMEAAEMLAADGIDAEVINFCTVKPLDEAALLASAKKTGKVVTAEEHSIIGGLGSAVAECLSEKLPTPLCRIGVRDVFGESGPFQELLHKYELDAEGVYQQVKAFLK